MKIYFTDNRARAISAALRNCLTWERAPQTCAVRKCRRDGCCTGPLACLRDEQIQLAAVPGASAGSSLPLPVCWFAVTEAQEANILMALASHLRALGRHFDSTVIETTRALSGRRWKRLGWGPLVSNAPAGSHDPEVTFQDPRPKSPSDTPVRKPPPKGPVIAPAFLLKPRAEN